MCLGFGNGCVAPKEKKGLSLVKPYTNADRINDMSVEEKAEFLDEHKIYRCLHCSYHYEEGDCHNKECKDGYKKWLESEATQGGKGV